MRQKKEKDFLQIIQDCIKYFKIENQTNTKV